ncbi:MAG TPA: hypothetical protein VFS30_06430 [Dehalococcoidia bacterium]|nr:hypothetical protein [Dehalococcoidia bacterium]
MLVLAFAGAAYGAAAVLPASGGTLQANTVSAICHNDIAPVNVGYTFDGDNLQSIDITGLDDDCSGASLTITANYDGTPEGDNTPDSTDSCTELIVDNDVSFTDTGALSECTGALDAAVTVAALISVDLVIQ